MIMIDWMSVLFGMALAPYFLANLCGYRPMVAGCKVESAMICLAQGSICHKLDFVSE
jgi:hypothetical protein